MGIIRKRFISALLVFCFMSLSAASFAESDTGENNLPVVKILKPIMGDTLSVWYEGGINHPNGNRGAAIDVEVEFLDSGYEFEKLEFYVDNILVFTTSDKKEKYQWWVKYSPGPIQDYIKVVCYYTGGIKVESTPIYVTVHVRHSDRHYYKIDGSIVLDMPTAEQNALFLKDITVDYRDTLDQNGRFNFVIPYNQISVIKMNYLKIILEVPSGNYNCSFPPIKMIPGDININGVQDGTINMLDVFQIAKCFSTVKGDATFDESLDFNMDGNINMQEVIEISRNFGATVPTIRANG